MTSRAARRFSSMSAFGIVPMEGEDLEMRSVVRRETALTPRR